MGSESSNGCRLFELIPPERVTKYLVTVQGATGLPVVLVDDGGVVLASPGAGDGSGVPRSFSASRWEFSGGVSQDGPDIVEGAGGGSFMRAPVVHRDRRLCWAAVRFDGADAEKRRVMDVVALAAAHLKAEAESGYEVESLSGEVVRVYEELALIFGITARLGAIVDVAEICRVIAGEAGRLLDAKDILVQLVDENMGVLKTVYAQGEHAEESYGFAPEVEYGLVGSAYLGHRPVLVCEVDEDKRHTGWPYPIRRLLSVPLMAEGKVTGVVTATDKRNGSEFDSREEKLVSAMASVAAIAIKNAQLYSEIKGLLEGFISASVTAVESRDPTTAGHSNRVAKLTVELAKNVDASEISVFRDVKFSREDLKELHYAGLLHDFGKIGVRESVLLKEGKLYTEHIEKIRSRFGIIREQTVRRSAERKLELLLERGEAAYKEGLPGIEEVLDREVSEIEKYLRLVEMANDPKVLLTELPDSDRLAELTGRFYSGPDGESMPYLTKLEFESLKVLKGSLNDKERHEIESHVTHSYNFLRQVPWTRGFSNIAGIVLSHHEKLDGSGYPAGLKGGEIPIQAKIMAVADIFDALTAWDRPYKDSVSTQKALFILEMEANNGKLEPHLVQIFRDSGVYRAVDALRPKRRVA